MSTSTGKIGRLEQDLRRQVNIMIRDNKPATTIINFLQAEGVRNISPQNVSSWKANGYQNWARIQDRVYAMKLRTELAKDLVETDGGEGLNLQSEATARLGMDVIQDCLEEFNPEDLKVLLANKPEKFLGLIDALSALRKGDQAYIKIKMEFEQYQAKVKAAADRLIALSDSSTSAEKGDLEAIGKELYGV